MKKLVSLIASTVLTVSSLTAVSSFAVNNQNELSVSKTVLSSNVTADDGTVIPAGAVAINVNITDNCGFDSSMIKIDLGNNYDVINNAKDMPVLFIGSAMGESRVVASGDNTIAIVSASTSVTSNDGLLFTIFAYENETVTNNDITVIDSEFSVLAEEDLIPPCAVTSGASYVIGDVNESGSINSSDASQVLHAISIHEQSCDRNCVNPKMLPLEEAKLYQLFYFPNTTYGAEAADVFKVQKISEACADDILGYYSCISSGKNYSDYYMGHVGEKVYL